MTTITDAPAISDARWHALAVDWPESCRVHHCWVDQCPDGSHDTGDDREGEA